MTISTIPTIPRIAFCSPVNPAPSGISDYSEELLPYLAQYADITLYVEDSLRPDNLHIRQHMAVYPLRTLARHHQRTPYHAILYHMGNSPAHAQIWQVAQRVPGIIVIHDFVLHHFMLWYAANVHHDIQHYVAYMQQHYGESGHHVAQLMIRGRFTEAAFLYPCCEQVVQAARGIITHSRFVQQQVAAIRPDVPTAIVPMGIPLPPTITHAAARQQLAIAPSVRLLVSFGHINAYKRLEAVLEALIELRHMYPTIRYVLVGSVSPNYDAQGIIERMGLQDVVQVTGYVPRATFEAYVAAADVCLNLRHPTAGETSASLLRLLGAGRPTLVSATGAFAELPPHVVAHVHTDATERDLIVAYCHLLLARPDVANRLGTAAREFVATHHTLEQAAKQYAIFLATHYRWHALTRTRNTPLWNPAHPTSSPHVVPTPLPNHSPQHAASAPFAVLQRSSSLHSIASALIDMGYTEDDETVLPALAEHLATIGWHV